MKKFIIILLIILPIFLMVTISLAGRIFSYITYINVEKVSIVDDLEKDVEEIILNKNDTHELIVKIFPELASNKKVNFYSLDKNIATVSKDGLITAVNYGITTVTVQSQDNANETDSVTINVTSNIVESIEIGISEKQMSQYETFSLGTPTIYPETAKSEIIWESSDPSYVSVDKNGRLTAHKITEDGKKIIITATTKNGNKSDTCEVTVVAHLLAFKPLVTEETNIYVSNQTTLNLLDLILYDQEKINPKDIQFKNLSNKSYASISNSVISFNTNFEGEYIIIKASVNNGSVKTELEFYVRYLSNA